MRFYLFILLALIPGIQQAQSGQKPDDSRFVKVVLDNDLNEPMEIVAAADGMIYYIERLGQLNRLDPNTGQKKRIAKVPVRSTGEDGLIGLALDPNFLQNHWIYLHYGDLVPIKDTFFNVVSRFSLWGDSLSLSSRKDLLRIPVIREGVSHSAGSLAFDAKGNLFVATGDNTNPFESDGYAPIDDRPERQRFDALRSSGNTNDLRGKILRIHPEANGSYSIPPGNLFPPGTPNTRPEIYVMGLRNPYRIHVDTRTGVLYWGEVGPDAGNDKSDRGPRGHDEFNRAPQAGNFGWPLVIGNNKPYHYYNFNAQTALEAVNPSAPLNRSNNNTGLTQLPPAQPAFIWYPYSESPEFPELGTGGRNAIGGPIYYREDYPASGRNFPAYFNGRWFIADWMRNWIFSVEMDANGKLVKMEPFLSGESFSKPIDMTFGRDGALYLLEYGQYWRTDNNDAQLVRIEYTEGNRAPIARIQADRVLGAAPLKVNFSATNSFDYDKNDVLQYRWECSEAGMNATGAAISFTFEQAGEYNVKLTVSDVAGKNSSVQQLIRVGNEPPQVNIKWAGNRSFYRPDQPIAYQVQVADREDGKLKPQKAATQLKVALLHLPEGTDFAGLAGTQELKPLGLQFIENSDCLACHARDAVSVGPSFIAISQRYDASAAPILTQRIIQGGGGVWGKEHVMSAHPQLTTEQAHEMVRYILALKDEPPRLPSKGIAKMDQPQGLYQFLATYTDAGGLNGQASVLLRPTRMPASLASLTQGVGRRNLPGGGTAMTFNESGAWLAFEELDLTGVSHLAASFVSPNLEGELELHLDAPDGPLIGSLKVAATPKDQIPRIPISPTPGMHRLYVLYREKQGGISIWRRLELYWLEVDLAKTK